MKFCLLTSLPSTAIQLVYYVQTRGVKFDDVVIIGTASPEYAIFTEYAQINNFRLHFVSGANEPDCLALMDALKPDIIKIVTVEIIRAELIKRARIGILNTHAAMLPRFRGVDTPYWAILEGGPVGVVEHFVDETIDTGDIVCSRELALRSGDTLSGILYRNHYENKWQACADALVAIQQGTYTRTKQRPEDGKQFFAMHPTLLKCVEAKLAQN